MLLLLFTAKSCPSLYVPMNCSLPGSFLCPSDFQSKTTGVGCHFLLQGVFPTQGSNLHLLHWQVGSLSVTHQGSPKTIYLLSILFVSIHLRIETLITRLRKSHLIPFLYFLSLFTSYHFLWNYCISSSWGASGLNVSFFSSSIYFKVYFLLFFLKAFISNYFLGL